MIREKRRQKELMSGRISRLTLHEIKRIHHQKEFSSDGSAKISVLVTF